MLKKHNNKLFLIVILLCLLVISISIVAARRPLPKNQIFYLEDESSALEFIRRNTPTRINVTAGRFGDFWVNDSEQVFEIWNSLNNLFPLLQQDQDSNPAYELTVEFFDGNTEKFAIQSPRILSQREFINSQLEFEYVRLTNALIGEVYSSDNLANLIEESNKVFIFHSNFQYPDNMNRTIKLDDYKREELVSKIKSSDKILDDRIINDYLEEDRYSPSYHIMLESENDGRFSDVISVLSQGIFFYTDTEFTHRTNIYYTGNLYNFIEETLENRLD